MKKEIIEKESGSKIERINKALREKDKEENKGFAAVKNNKFFAKITTVLKSLDLKRSGVLLAVVLFVIILFTVIIPNANKIDYVAAYQVYLNDKDIGAMADVSGLETMLETIYAEHESYYGMEVSKDVALSYYPIYIEQGHLCPSSYYEDILRNNMEVNVVAWVIFVNNSPVIALNNREDAQWILEQLTVPYKNEEGAENRTDIGFLENVEIKSEAISYSKVTDKDTGLRIMQYGDDIEIFRHKVVSGESLYTICKSYDLSLVEIRKANPSLPADGKIYSGDLLIVTKINNVVNIVYTEYEERAEKMEYETTVLYDDTMYESQTRVQQQGITGTRNIKANVYYINGSESSYEVLVADPPTQEPVNEILVKGTVPVPAVLKLANSGGMALPLSSYTMTSDYGPRNTGIEGASTFHNGVDLAASCGTPIYASAEGKVSFAGSSGGYGLMVKIKHDGGVETRYGHCSTLLVSSGEYVKKGQVIALVGSTGTSSGNHVHFEVRINGEPVDPLG